MCMYMYVSIQRWYMCVCRCCREEVPAPIKVIVAPPPKIVAKKPSDQDLGNRRKTGKHLTMMSFRDEVTPAKV